MGRIGSVEQWWGLYCHLARPSELPPLSDLHLFKLGIKPMWEDPANVNGGKWVSEYEVHLQIENTLVFKILFFINFLLILKII